MAVRCKIFGHEWRLNQRSNVIQSDSLGYPLRLFICECSRCRKSEQIWLSSTECKNDVVLQWYDDDYIPIPPKAENEDKEKLSWLGKNCKDCGNEKCKKLGTLPKGYDCALWQPKVENYSIKTVTNAKEAEIYPISEDISKGIEEINKIDIRK